MTLGPAIDIHSTLHSIALGPAIEYDEFVPMLRTLHEPLSAQMLDLRSTLAREVRSARMACCVADGARRKECWTVRARNARACGARLRGWRRGWRWVVEGVLDRARESDLGECHGTVRE